MNLKTLSSANPDANLLVGLKNSKSSSPLPYTKGVPSGIFTSKTLSFTISSIDLRFVDAVPVVGRAETTPMSKKGNLTNFKVGDEVGRKLLFNHDEN